MRPCSADVSELSGLPADPKDLLVPFNDLLPPLFEEASTTTTAAAVAAAATTTTTSTSTTTTTTTAKPETTTASLFTKPTKKSYYHQQMQHIKELHLIDDDVKVTHDQTKPNVNKQEIQLLSLELLPPLEEVASNDVPKTEAADTSAQHVASTVSITQDAAKPALATTQHVSSFVNLQQAGKPAVTTTQHVSSFVSSQQAGKPAVAATQHVSSFVSNQRVAKPLKQYATYFQHSTPRPRRGPLPTLTPFPRHLK
ncbi:cell wall protein DAN4 [Scaptodrosophila lebanonensis]|uniref:Cell wall protein DAN4 n=1 Tax=Drosophila lebanonensis TaxID=7225 RepID=A0A6J2TBR0_DROLE|nr:cell wall protein DAN4 [Scaptodrosophila lebanonensis]